MRIFPHVIEIERIGERVSDGAGGYTESWVLDRETVANVQPFRSTEYFRMNTNNAENKTYFKIFIPYQEGITDDMRIKYEGKHYDIQRPTDQGGLKKVIQFICTLWE